MAESQANGDAGINTSALIVGKQTAANALAAPAPVVKDKAKPHDATRTAKQPKPRGERDQKPYDTGKGRRKNGRAFDTAIDRNIAGTATAGTGTWTARRRRRRSRRGRRQTQGRRQRRRRLRSG